MSDYKTTLDASRSMKGALGAVAFVVMEGLSRGGADGGDIAEVGRLMHEHFAKLTDADCNVLSDVVFSRLAEQLATTPYNRWYADE